jgi:hypothetical protein
MITTRETKANDGWKLPDYTQQTPERKYSLLKK